MSQLFDPGADLGSSEQTVLIGAHELRQEDDIVLLRLCGEVSHFEVVAMHAALLRTKDQHGRVYVLVDLRQAGNAGEKVRKEVVEWYRTHRVGCIATFGASAANRVIYILVTNAIRLFAKRVPPIKFFSEEYEARSWIARLRREADSLH